jgi:iron complex outermembrane receptor protein
MTSSHDARLMRALLIGSAAAALGAGGAMAQPVASTGGAQAETIQEVVVTARRVSEKLQDVPLSVTALNKSALQDNHIESVYDIKNIVPNLFQEKTSTLGGGELFIRGLLSQGLPNATLDTRVGIYVDGVYLARPEGINTGMADIAEVEVNKGPQGTLFGHNVTGGSIAFTTQGPTGQWGGEADASYGNYDAQRYKFVINTPETHGLSTRFSYSHDQMDGDVKNLAAGTQYGVATEPQVGYSQYSKPATSTLGGHNNDAFFFAARYTGVDKLTVDYKFDYSDNKEMSQEIQPVGILPSSVGCEIAGYYLGLSIDGCLGGVASSHTGASPTIGALGSTAGGVTSGPAYTGNTPLSFTKLGAKSTDFSGGAIIRSFGHNLTTQYDLTDDIKVKSITSYRQLSANGQIDTDGANYRANPAYFQQMYSTAAAVFGGYPTSQPNFGLAYAAGQPILAQTYGPISNIQAGQSLCVSCSYNRQQAHQFSEEVQLIGKWGNMLDYLVGAYYFNEHTQGESYYQFDSVPNFTYFGQAIPPLGQGQPVTLNLGGFANGELEHFQSKSYALFSHVVYHATDKLDLSVGLRETVDDRTDEVPQDVVNLLLGQGLNSLGTHPGVQYARFTYDGTISYKVTPDVNVYSRYATAYLAGGFFNTVPYLPEDSFAEEIGVKSEWLDHRLRVNGDVFYQHIKNFQNVGQTPFGGIFVNNLKLEENEGFEIETSLVPMRGVTLNGNVGYAHIYNSIGQLDTAPEWTAQLSGQYDAPRFANGMYLQFKADADYRSHFATVQFGLFDPREGYTNYFSPAYIALHPADLATPGTPSANYAALLTYLGYPATAAGENQYVSALQKASTGGDFWLTNFRASLLDVPMGATKGRISAYVKNAFNVRGVTTGSNYGGYVGDNFEQDRTFGVDLQFQF